MITRTLNLAKCVEGDILADDIINDLGVILVSKDTIINGYIKAKLADHGISRVKIRHKSAEVESDLQNNYIDIVIQTKKIFQELVSGKPFDYHGISGIIENIFNNTNENEKIIKCLVNVRKSDEYTYAHCVNVAFYSMLIARWLGLSDRKVKMAAKAGLLHDIGKAKVPNDILNKKGALTEEEFETIKKHTVLGYEIVKDIDEIDNEIKKAVLLHHERINGSGYPYHFYCDNLNLFSKIVAVADVFDAMTSDRVYKGRSTPFEVFEMFKTVGVGLFDIKILNIFLNRLATYLIGAKVLLNSGKTAEIVCVPVQNIIYPIVRVETEYVDLSQFDKIKIVSMLDYN